MARKNTPEQAYNRYIDRLERALGCISPRRLDLVAPVKFQLDADYPLVLNNNDSVLLRGEADVFFSAGQRFRIVEDKEIEHGPYRVHTVEYWYQIDCPEDSQVLTYHWKPESDTTSLEQAPHLHIGSSVVANDAPLMRKTFSKLHIPTGRVSIESIVRFLIIEIKVHPSVIEWETVLDEGQRLFDTFRRRHFH